jgi:hypothetical protein
VTTAAVNDFSAIKASLARLEEEKKPAVVVTDGEPTQWVDAVYGHYSNVQDTGPRELTPWVWSPEFGRP